MDGGRSSIGRSAVGLASGKRKRVYTSLFFQDKVFPYRETRVILEKIYSRTISSARGGKSEKIDCLHIPRQSLLGMTVSAQKDSGRGGCMQRRREEVEERDAIKATQFDLEKGGDGNDRSSHSSQCACSVSVVVQ